MIRWAEYDVTGMIEAGMNTSTAPRVLVVDDDPAIREFVGELLQDEGYEVRLATDGEEALQLLEAWPANLIILDLMMPRMDGWAFRRQQRTRLDLVHIPVIIMSASREIDIMAEELEASTILPKPFDLEALLTETERLLPLQTFQS
jgi:CheY-like chemotaxis protein